MRNEKVWQFVHQVLDSGRSAVLMVVVKSEGSSPGRQGFKMAVAGEHAHCGTVGGGVMEHKLIRTACEMLDGQHRSPLFLRQVHDNRAPADRSGMICAGYQIVVLQRLDSADAGQIKTLLDRFGESGFRLSPNGIDVTARMQQNQWQIFADDGEGHWSYSERTGLPDTIYIVGGGHVGLALSRVMAMLDFRIVVCDHRPDLDTLHSNTFTHEKIIGPYEELDNYVPEGEHSYVAVVSTNFKTDEAALRRLVRRKYRYLGVMGSQAKIAHLFEVMRGEGVSEELLENVHAPIGLNIHSQTAEEIGISIAAQIISIRNRQIRATERPEGTPLSPVEN